MSAVQDPALAVTDIIDATEVNGLLTLVRTTLLADLWAIFTSKGPSQGT